MRIQPRAGRNEIVGWRADGALVYHGRIDDQVKLRGVRIEPGEIEAALAGQSGIAQAAVVLRTDQGEARLIAYVAPTAGILADGIDLDELRARL